MSTTQVWGEGRKDLWTPDGFVTVPSDYEYLPAGDGPLTLAVKKANGKQPIFAVMKRVSKRYPPRQIGFWAPATVIHSERRRLLDLRTPQRAAKAAEIRERRQQRGIKDFVAAVLHQYPGCPRDEAEAIARWTCQIGSGRVGRSTVADDPIRAAVIAHIRHVHTDYDELLEANQAWALDGDERRLARIDARDEVRDEVYEILGRWEKPGGDSLAEADNAAALIGMKN